MSQTTVLVDFIAKKEEDFISKVHNFESKIDNYVPILALDEAKITSLKAHLKAYVDACNRKNALHAEARAATQTCNELLNPLTKEIRVTKKDIQMSPNCSPAVIVDLGMDNTKRVIDVDIDFPTLSTKSVAGFPQVKYTKGPYSGIRLTCVINNGEKEYQETVTQHYYNDTFPRINPQVPETRVYTAYFMKKGKIVGQRSKPVTFILEPI
ncbi:hypothetical protein DWB61_05870 [Ancylomarina euxinus]|uniref:Uncharacterized protein n=1 Tax=Ancylomarina euxinus TaxID=2283627 RepID=A0A425Y3X3_9BACT|nr:hypothetical protein [Ancylomarina euxinus]MCZ4694564.1 hypothetical protein [Ancylomarina euxinus]MUP14107.1 hypothetical protein [Ancylomarina euxinus]RRG22964.1 hypothetical protein DWB61_05870 [Ancylomarina euxinus]